MEKELNNRLLPPDFCGVVSLDSIAAQGVAGDFIGEFVQLLLYLRVHQVTQIIIYNIHDHQATAHLKVIQDNLQAKFNAMALGPELFTVGEACCIDERTYRIDVTRCVSNEPERGHGQRFG